MMMCLTCFFETLNNCTAKTKKTHLFAKFLRPIFSEGKKTIGKRKSKTIWREEHVRCSCCFSSLLYISPVKQFMYSTFFSCFSSFITILFVDVTTINVKWVYVFLRITWDKYLRNLSFNSVYYNSKCVIF